MKTISLRTSFDSPSTKEVSIQLPASKSIANRALIIKALSEDRIEIENLSTAKDTVVLNSLLNERNLNKEWNVGIAGTACRFLTAYLTAIDGSFVLTGEQRMKERPIGILVEALRELGGDIEYLEKEGYPPLKINGGRLTGERVALSGNTSSQYISALALIGPCLPHGLEIQLEGDLVSRPYLEMTLSLMRSFGIGCSFEKNRIQVEKGSYVNRSVKVESDWSAASYWYSLVALSQDLKVELLGLNKESLQGDSALSDIYTCFGVQTVFTSNGVKLEKVKEVEHSSQLDLIETPDLAQTIVVTAAGLNIPMTFTGLKTLRIKETDRLEALRKELSKFGAEVEIIGDDAIVVKKGIVRSDYQHVAIDTYEDHRMAMAFAPLATLYEFNINDPEVVVKSYPHFWEDWGTLFRIEEK